MVHCSKGKLLALSRHIKWTCFEWSFGGFFQTKHEQKISCNETECLSEANDLAYSTSLNRLPEIEKIRPDLKSHQDLHRFSIEQGPML
jgi:hypothetical protein